MNIPNELIANAVGNVILKKEAKNVILLCNCSILSFLWLFFVCFKINKDNIDKEVDSLELKDIALKFVDRHEDFVREDPNTRILKQVVSFLFLLKSRLFKPFFYFKRLSVIEIPLIECIYSYNDKHGVIYLYDNQKKVYLPNELVDKKSKCSIS